MNICFYITTFLPRRTMVFKLCKVSALIRWLISVSHVLCLSSQVINLTNITKHKIGIMLFPFLLKDKNLFWPLVHNLLKKEHGEEYIMMGFIICTVHNKVVEQNYPRELDYQICNTQGKVRNSYKDIMKLIIKNRVTGNGLDWNGLGYGGGGPS